MAWVSGAVGTRPDGRRSAGPCGSYRGVFLDRFHPEEGVSAQAPVRSGNPDWLRTLHPAPRGRRADIRELVPCLTRGGGSRSARYVDGTRRLPISPLID
eukprot:4927906-Prymnesium_polylepis.1